MWLAAAIAVAEAGCGVDPDPAATRAAATLVATGEVVSLAFVDPSVVESVVRLDRPRVGRVDSGYVALRVDVSGGACPGAEVHVPGERVAIVATPDEDGVVWPSACRPDVLPADADLAGAGARARPGRWAGAPPPTPVLAAPYPTPDGRRARVARLGVARLGGVELHAGGPTAPMEASVVAPGPWARLLVEDRDAWLVVELPEDDLALAPVRAVSPAPGVRLLPGARVTVGDGVVAYAEDGVEVAGPAPLAAFGRYWTPARDAAPASGASIDADQALLASPGGPIVAVLRAAGARFGLGPTGRVAQGHTEVTVTATGLRATGWLPTDALRPPSLSMSGYGSGSGGLAARITLAPDLELSTPDGRAAIARNRTAREVGLLATDGPTAWVALPTPWGVVAARATCAVEAVADGTCAP